VDAPTQTATYDGSTLRSQASAIVESLVTGLVFGTAVRQEVEQRVGGNPSGNTGADYAARVPPAERQLIETVSPGSTDRNLARLDAAPPVSPDSGARERFEQLGTPSGAVRVPTLTLHTRADPLVLVQNEANAAKPDRLDLGPGSKMKTLVPPAGFEPAPLPPEGSALSPELRGLSDAKVTSPAQWLRAAGGGLPCRRAGASPWCCSSTTRPWSAGWPVPVPAGGSAAGVTDPVDPDGVLDAVRRDPAPRSAAPGSGGPGG
jgi:hypothetical protein